MKVIACMSGTSLDGLDVALCEFAQTGANLSYKIAYAETYEFDEKMKYSLSNSMNLSGKDLTILDNEFAYWIADKIGQFVEDYKIDDFDYVASHGQTVFHNPSEKYTKQIGSGVVIASVINKPVVYDFRTLDVSLGGQGAPLVPIGDKLLFSNYDYCLNLGGFSNVSYEAEGQRIAFDISPVNIVCNQLSEVLGLPYDRGGLIGREGVIIKTLFDALNRLPYYAQTAPKSLGKEWVDKYIQPLIDDYSKTEDVLRTFYEHVAYQIARVLKGEETHTLVTGGGAYNTFLIERIKHYCESEIILPDALLVEYKEALIFGLLAFLRITKQVNTLASVTGAERDSSGGVIAYP